MYCDGDIVYLSKENYLTKSLPELPPNYHRFKPSTYNTISRGGTTIKLVDGWVDILYQDNSRCVVPYGVAAVGKNIAISYLDDQRTEPSHMGISARCAIPPQAADIASHPISASVLFVQRAKILFQDNNGHTSPHSTKYREDNRMIMEDIFLRIDSMVQDGSGDIVLLQKDHGGEIKRSMKKGDGCLCQGNQLWIVLDACVDNRWPEASAKYGPRAPNARKLGPVISTAHEHIPRESNKSMELEFGKLYQESDGHIQFHSTTCIIKEITAIEVTLLRVDVSALSQGKINHTKLYSTGYWIAGLRIDGSHQGNKSQTGAVDGGISRADMGEKIQIRSNSIDGTTSGPMGSHKQATYTKAEFFSSPKLQKLTRTNTTTEDKEGLVGEGGDGSAKAGLNSGSSCDGQPLNLTLSSNSASHKIPRAYGGDKDKSGYSYTKDAVDNTSYKRKLEGDNQYDHELLELNAQANSSLPNRYMPRALPPFADAKSLRWDGEGQDGNKPGDELEDGDDEMDEENSCCGLGTPLYRINPENMRGRIEEKGREGSSRKRSAHRMLENQPEGHGQGEDQFLGPPSKKFKGQNKPSDRSRKLFACPYFKKNPLKYSSCSEWRDSRIRQVREHCKINHLKPLRCGRCKRFRAGDHDHIMRHLENENCEKSVTSDLLERDTAQEKAHDLDKAKTWQRIYEILFPLHIPNQFWQNQTEVLMSSIKENELSFTLRVRDAISSNKREYQSGLAEYLQNRIGLEKGDVNKVLSEYEKIWASKNYSQASLLNDGGDYGHSIGVKYLST